MVRPWLMRGNSKLGEGIWSWSLPAVLTCLGLARRCPRTKFYSYTRSWRQDSIREVLAEVARLRNFRVWLSADRDTGLPPTIPGTEVAWLLTLPGEQPPAWADLVFRTKAL